MHLTGSRGQAAAADRHPDPVRLAAIGGGRAPLRVARGRTSPTPPGLKVRRVVRTRPDALLDDPAGDRVGRPDRCSFEPEATLLGEGRGWTPRPAFAERVPVGTRRRVVRLPGPRTPRSSRTGRMVRTAMDAATGTRARGGGATSRVIDLRSPVAAGPRNRSFASCRAPDRPAGGRARGRPASGGLRRSSGGRRPRVHRGVLLLAGVAGAAGHRVRHSRTRAARAEDGVPCPTSTPRPDAVDRTSRWWVNMSPGSRMVPGCPTWAKGLTEAGDPSKWLVAEGDMVTAEPAHRPRWRPRRPAVEIPRKWGRAGWPGSSTGRARRSRSGTPIISIDTDPGGR